MKIWKDEKSKRKEFVKAWRRKGIKGKVKWKKKKKRKGEGTVKWITFFFMLFLWSLSSLKSGGVTWYPTGRREIKLLLLVFELTVSSRQKKWPLRKECGSHRGHQVLALSNLRSLDTGRGKREKPNDWLGPQNGSKG